MDDEYDFVVVGAGSAGSPVAAGLSERPDSPVLLLEAGPVDDADAIRVPAAFPSLFHTELDWDYRTEPQRQLAGREVCWPRGRTLGGSSSINAMMWVRGCRADYDEWAELCGPTWSYESMLERFLLVEDTETPDGDHQGTGGPLSVSRLRDPNPLTPAYLAACAEVGLPPVAANLASPVGATAAMVTQREGRRWSAADAYLRPAEGRPNLTVRTDAHATRILFEGRRAVGVEYVHGGTVRRARARREVVLCGGAVNSPQLLMLSGVGDAGQLRAHGIPVVLDVPEVGRNLQDHLMAMLTVRCTEPVTLADAPTRRQMVRYHLRRTGLLSSNVAEAYAFARSDPALPEVDLEVVFVPGPFADEGFSPELGHAMSIGSVLLRPRSRGHVRLLSKDPLAAPAIDPRYLSDPGDHDRRVLTAGVALCERILAAPALAPYVGVPLRPPQPPGAERLAAAVDRHTQTLYHPVGTCRMGLDPDSVVDPELRVRGILGLRVADASVMPVIMRGHPHAASVVIGRRAVDLITATRPLVAHAGS